MNSALRHSLICLVLLFGMTSVALAAAPLSVEINKGKLVRLASPVTTIAIADPAIADAQVLSPKLIYISGKQIGETSVLAVGKGDNVVYDGTVEVTHNITKLKSSLAEMMPGSDVHFSSTDSALVLQGEVDSPYQAQRLQQLAATYVKSDQKVVNMLNIRDGDQVMLKVKIAEVSRTALKRFGINLEAALTSGNFVFGLANGRDIVNGAGQINRNLQLDGNVLASYQTGSVNLNGLIDALETDGLVTVLAEPNLTTKSGTPASFLAGGEYPIPVVQGTGTGSNTVTIEYRQYGVGLNFTPTVLSKDKISIAVNPEVSTLSNAAGVTANGFNIPSLLTRKASTTVELGSGDSFAIAGLLRRDDTNDVSKLPLLGDLPIIGALFRSTAFQQEQTELVIIVTPYIVKAVKDAEIATPVDGYQPPSDFERILLGRLYHADPDADATQQENPVLPTDKALSKLNGPAGFMVPGG